MLYGHPQADFMDARELGDCHLCGDAVLETQDHTLSEFMANALAHEACHDEALRFMEDIWQEDQEDHPNEDLHQQFPYARLS